MITGHRQDTNRHAKPFLKWAGGKQRLLAQYAPHIPPSMRGGRYYEPFIGSAAMFFHLQRPRSTLSDRNRKLVELYQLIKEDLTSVIQALKLHRNEADYYYHIRSQDPEALTPAERAARLIYLNRTCYNGLYRENSRGLFNVPFGRYKNPTICNEEKLKAAARALKDVRLVAGDFAETVASAAAGDLVYFDPPYVPLTSTSSFTSYDKRGFGEADHLRLCAEVKRLSSIGCSVMLSNSDTQVVRELYRGPQFRLIPIKARRNINSKGNRRGAVSELLILNYDADWKLLTRD
jgi:DNA adenine methylase